MKKEGLLAGVAILVGTCVGAGFLGIPYVVSKSGFLPGIFLIFLVALFILLTKLYLGEVILRTKGTHQLSGYAEKYLGKKGEWLMFFAMVFGLYSALVAYMIGEGETLSYIFSGGFDYSLHFSLGFFILMSFLTYIGFSALKKYEKIAMFIVFFFLALICLFFTGSVNYENLLTSDCPSFFLPFGVIVFSFLAFSAMPEVERVLKGKEKLMKKTIILGVIIPFIVYIIFTFIMVGNFGTNLQEIAVLNLGRFFSLLAVLTMFTAFFVLSIALRDMFRFDFNYGRTFSWALSLFVPLLLFLIISFFSLATFTEVLSYAGVISGGLTGILILFMNIKAKKKGNRKPEYSIKINWFIVLLLSILFILAVLAEFLF
jgi:amino acid permease